MYKYYVVVDVDDIISKFETTFLTEEDANNFADSIREYIVEFSFVQMVEKAFTPPF